MKHIANNMPIRWFGDKEAYFKSDIKIITVGLNPSNNEFINVSDEYPAGTRFPKYNGIDPEPACNDYFNATPYMAWFSSFEYILNGMDASYLGSKFKNRVLHTDLCTPYATNPTWSKLSKIEQNELMANGIPELKQFVDELNPDIIIFSIPKNYVKNYICKDINEFLKITLTKDGTLRKKPKIIHKGFYKDILCIFGTTRNTPFGDIDSNQKTEIGKMILNELKEYCAQYSF